MSPTAVVDSSLPEHRVVDGGVTPQKIVLNNCPDIHIGPKFVRNNNITINNGGCYDDTVSVGEDVNAKSPYGFVHKFLKLQNGIRIRIILYGSSFLFILLIIVPAIVLVNQNDEEPDQPQPEDNEDYPLDKKFVMREAWGASPPCLELTNNTMPLGRVLFIHSAGSRTCNSLAACKPIVLDIQDISKKECNPNTTYGDIMYNFVIGSDGHIFVGRGWDKIGSHTYGSNTGFLGVAFIGDFRRDEPSSMMLESAKTLLEVGVARSKLKEDYQFFGHCQRHSGFPYSPGVNILKHIQTWPHWNRSNLTNCADFIPSNHSY